MGTCPREVGPPAPGWAVQENKNDTKLCPEGLGRSICCSSVQSPTPSHTQTFQIKWEVYFSKNCVASLIASICILHVYVYICIFIMWWLCNNTTFGSWLGWCALGCCFYMDGNIVCIFIIWSKSFRCLLKNIKLILTVILISYITVDKWVPTLVTCKYGSPCYINRITSYRAKWYKQKSNPFMAAYKIDLKRVLTLKIEHRK